MARFKCEKCKLEKIILKQTLVFLDGEIRAKESKCKCGNYMKDLKNIRVLELRFRLQQINIVNGKG